jgi:hypothetical protein
MSRSGRTIRPSAALPTHTGSAEVAELFGQLQVGGDRLGLLAQRASRQSSHSSEGWLGSGLGGASSGPRSAADIGIQRCESGARLEPSKNPFVIEPPEVLRRADLVSHIAKNDPRARWQDGPPARLILSPYSGIGAW